MNSDWISVKDRLPKGEPIWRYIPNVPSTASVWITYTPETIAKFGVTHWMPATLPEPPKIEAEMAFEKWACLRPIGGNISRDFARCIFLAGWQACEKRGGG